MRGTVDIIPTLRATLVLRRAGQIATCELPASLDTVRRFLRDGDQHDEY